MHYEVTEFNKRRLSRGEIIDWVWLSASDIADIYESETDTVSGHAEFSKEFMPESIWNKLW